MSDDEDSDVASQSQQSAPLPVVPPNQGPPYIPLSVLLDFAIQKTNQELTIKTQLLPNMSDMDRKIEIVQFAHKTRQLFIRLLALVKWAKSAGKVDVCTAVSCFLTQQCSYFVETADALFQLAKEFLTEARLPAFQIPAAVDVLTLGNYSRLPVCLKSRFISDDVITNKEQASVLQRLNQILRYKLINDARDLPVEYKIFNGIVTFRVRHEFEASLTLLGETNDVQWTLLNVKILVQDYDIGEGADLVHPLQVHYLHTAVQARVEVAPRPIVEMYDILHTFCLSLQLDILYCQTSKLIFERLNDNISIEEYIGGQKLTVCYWKNQLASLPAPLRSLPAAVPPAPIISYRIIIEIMDGVAFNSAALTSSSPCCRKILRVSHLPSSDDDLPILADYKNSEHSKLSMENLITDTQLKRSELRLKQIKERIDNLFSLPPSSATVECNLRSTACPTNHGASRCLLVADGFAPPRLNVALFNNAAEHELITISVNLFTGRYLVESELLATSAFLTDLDRVLNCTNWHNLRQVLADLRIAAFLEKCKKHAAYLPACIIDRLAIVSSSSALKSLPEHKLILKFNRFDNYLMILTFSCDRSNLNQVRIRYYLASFVSNDSFNGFPSNVRISTFVELNDNTANWLNKTQAPSSKRPKLINDNDEIGRIFCDLPALFDSCDQRIPFMMLCEQLDKRGVRFQISQQEDDCDCMSLRIIGFSDPSACCSKPMADQLWSHLVSCTGRLLLDKTRPQFTFEWIFCDVPFSSDDFSLVMNSRSPQDNPPVELVVRTDSTSPVDAERSVLMDVARDKTHRSRVGRRGRRTRMSTRTWPVPQSADGLNKVVDEFLSCICSFSRMDCIVRRFEPVYRRNRFLRDSIAVRSFTYHKFILSYGPERRFLVSMEYRCSEKCFVLSLGVSDTEIKRKNGDRKLSAPADNPDYPILPFLQNMLNETQNLARVLQILCETWPVLLALQQLPQMPLQLPSENLPSGYTQQVIASQMGSGPPGQVFFLAPASELIYRLMYRWTFCLEIICLAGGYVALRDARNSVNTKFAAKFLPIYGLQAFLALHEKSDSDSSTSAFLSDLDRSRSTKMTHPASVGPLPSSMIDLTKTASPAKSLPGSELKLFSPDSAVATPSPSAGVPPSPATNLAGYSTPVHHYQHHQQAPTPSPAGGPFSHGSAAVPLSPAPASNVGLFTPSPAAPLSNACMLMTSSPSSAFPQPSPAAQQNVPNPASAPSLQTQNQQMPRSQSPSTAASSSNQQVQSPLSALNEFAALSSDPKLPSSVEYAGSWGDLSGPSSAATPADTSIRSLTSISTPQQVQMSGSGTKGSPWTATSAASQRLVFNHDLTPSSKPIIVKNSTLAKLCAKPDDGDEPALLTKFFGTLLLFERLCRSYGERQTVSGP